ncbi:cytochrome P450 [Mycolicibacterium llatzerense]|nr:cytochrome P450 [Mycolicibacterium llatzerense]
MSAAALRRPARTRILAEPPAGSDLLPVPGDAGLPLIGYSLNVFDDLLTLQRQLYDRYGPVHWVEAFGTKLVLAVGPDAIGEVLANRDKAFANDGWEPFLGPFFTRGIILLDFDEHLHHRRIMQQAFTRGRLVDYLDIINDSASEALARWNAGPDIHVYTAAKQLTLDIATAVFVGAALGPEADQLQHAFAATVQGGLSLLRANIPGGSWHAGLRGRRVLETYFRDRLGAKRANPGTDVFGVLCDAVDETGARFTDDDIVNHMIFLLMAAHDTTTTTVAMMIYHLAAHPEWQERARAESRALNKPFIGYDDLDQLPILDRVFKETLRMCSPVGTLARKTVKDTELLGHYLPAGTLIGVSVSSSHRMRPWWDEPDTFDPDRFGDERREDKNHRHGFVPFGGGAHKCIGMFFGAMESKAILHQMLLQFSWSVPTGYQPPIGYLTGPYPSDGLPITLTRNTFQGSSR